MGVVLCVTVGMALGAAGMSATGVAVAVGAGVVEAMETGEADVGTVEVGAIAEAEVDVGTVDTEPVRTGTEAGLTGRTRCPGLLREEAVETTRGEISDVEAV